MLTTEQRALAALAARAPIEPDAADAQAFFQSRAIPTPEQAQELADARAMAYAYKAACNAVREAALPGWIARGWRPGSGPKRQAPAAVEYAKAVIRGIDNPEACPIQSAWRWRDQTAYNEYCSKEWPLVWARRTLDAIKAATS